MSKSNCPYIGTAGWGIPSAAREHFTATGTLLERYAAQFNATEINSSFYRPHRHSTYVRWAASVPARFRFAVKLPKTITHERRLRHCEADVENFVSQVEGLGTKLGAVLVQLPPSLAFEAEAAKSFLGTLTSRLHVVVALEPRHRSWFTDAVDNVLIGIGVARVAADPAIVPAAAEPGGWRGLAYYRLHGSPRVYYSDYEADLTEIQRRLCEHRLAWCIFDNTAAGAATGNALSLMSLVRQARSVVGP